MYSNVLTKPTRDASSWTWRFLFSLDLAKYQSCHFVLKIRIAREFKRNLGSVTAEVSVEIQNAHTIIDFYLALSSFGGLAVSRLKTWCIQALKYFDRVKPQQYYEGWTACVIFVVNGMMLFVHEYVSVYHVMIILLIQQNHSRLESSIFTLHLNHRLMRFVTRLSGYRSALFSLIWDICYNNHRYGTMQIVSVYTIVWAMRWLSRVICQADNNKKYVKKEIYSL